MGSPPRRLMLSDQRGEGRYLRVSWHPDTATVVFSHWVGDVCVASTPLHLAEAARMVGLIVGALQDTAAAAVVPKPAPPATSRVADLVERVRDRFRPRMAQIVELGERLRPHHQPDHPDPHHPDHPEQHHQL